MSILIVKYIPAVVIVFVLQQAVAALFSLLPLETACTACSTIIGHAWAEENNQDAPEKPQAPEAPPQPDEQTTKPGFMDLLHSGISQGLLETADWLDSFFADERSVKEENHSYLGFRYDVFGEKQSSTTFKPTINLRLILPQLEKKTHLVISGEPPETPKNNPTTVGTTTERLGTTEEKNLSTALHYFFRSTAQENIVVRTGVQLTRGKPVLFIAPRYRFLIPLQTWNFRFTQETLYRTDTGWQADSRFDLERQLSYELFFRTSLAGAWFANTNGYFYGLSFALRRPFGPKRALEFEWGNSFQTRPVGELTEVAFVTRYRQNFWREWFFFEIAPQCRFPRDREFHSTPGVLFRVEMFFGRKL